MFWTSRTSSVAAAHLEQRIVARGARIGRIEQQAVREARAPAGGQLPVLALDVVNDGGAWPGQQRRNDQADALAGTRRREGHHMLGTVVAQIVLAEAAEEHARVSPSSPARRTCR